MSGIRPGGVSGHGVTCNRAFGAIMECESLPNFLVPRVLTEEKQAELATPKYRQAQNFGIV
jgi:hypothetical protein